MHITAVMLVISFVAAAAGVLLVTPLAMLVARRLGFLDVPNERKVHLNPTPLLGGSAVFVVIFCLILFAGQALGLVLSPPRIGFLLGAVVIFLFGLADDRFGLSVFPKLIGQFIAAALLVLSGNTDGLIGHSPVALGLCLAWTVGLMNAVNFLDGLDGLAAGTTLIAGTAFAIVGLAAGQIYPALVAAVAAGAALGFLRWNWSPAKIFLGDAGSLFLGYLLAALGLMSTIDRPSIAYLLVPIIVLGVPIFDITFVVVVRLLERRPISEAGKDHTSHRILSVLRSVPSAVLLILAGSLVLGAVAVALVFLGDPWLLLAGAGACGILFLFLGSGLSRVPVEASLTTAPLRRFGRRSEGRISRAQAAADDDARAVAASKSRAPAGALSSSDELPAARDRAVPLDRARGAR